MNANLLGDQKMVPISKLRLDPFNPRLSETLHGSSQLDLAIALDMGFDAWTVAESIADHGYFAAEPMIVIPDESDSDSYIVVEGNRRLTAILGLIDKNIQQSLIDPDKWEKLSSSSTINQHTEVPIVVSPNRLAVVPIIGFRHISGILSWKPYPQACYIATLVDGHGMSMEEVAKAVGKKKSEVADLYRERCIAKQAKEIGIDTGNMERNFSILTVAMHNPSIRNHCGAPLGGQFQPGTKPIPEDKLAELKEILSYIFGDEENEPRITDSRQMNKLGKAIAAPESLSALRAGKSLEESIQAIPSPAVDP